MSLTWEDVAYFENQAAERSVAAAMSRFGDMENRRWKRRHCPTGHDRRAWFIYGAYQAVTRSDDFIATYGVSDFVSKPAVDFPPEDTQEAKQALSAFFLYEAAAEYTVSVAVGGSLLEVKRHKMPLEDRNDRAFMRAFTAADGSVSFQKTRVGGTRSAITKYSEASRWRFQKRLARFENRWLAAAQFVTLTYPTAYPDPKAAKLQLRAFIKRLRRKFPKACVIWRLEFQKRGAPHFHLLVLGVKWLPYHWVAENWFQVVGSGDEKHRYAGTEVKAVRAARLAIWYITKYMAKNENAIPVDVETGEILNVGRYWGVEGATSLFEAGVVKFKMHGWELLKIVRYLMDEINIENEVRKYRKKNRRKIEFNKELGKSWAWLTDGERLFDNMNSLLAQGV